LRVRAALAAKIHHGITLHDFSLATQQAIQHYVQMNRKVVARELYHSVISILCGLFGADEVYDVRKEIAECVAEAVVLSTQKKVVLRV
jgi:hypothetical protein